MLTKLMNLLEESKAPLQMNEVCEKLHTDRSVVEGMLMQLRRMGYLQEGVIQKADYNVKSTCGSCMPGKKRKCAGCG